MRKLRTTASFGYLMEIIIALCIFSISSLCCITLFIKSMQLQQDALYQNDAVAIAQSQISILKNTLTPSNGAAYYDEALIQQEDGPYQAVWNLEMSNRSIHGIMEVWKDDICLLHIPFAFIKGASL